jgi:hypothetical protein
MIGKDGMISCLFFKQVDDQPGGLELFCKCYLALVESSSNEMKMMPK